MCEIFNQIFIDFIIAIDSLELYLVRFDEHKRMGHYRIHYPMWPTQPFRHNLYHRSQPISRDSILSFETLLFIGAFPLPRNPPVSRDLVYPTGPCPSPGPTYPSGPLLSHKTSAIPQDPSYPSRTQVYETLSIPREPSYSMEPPYLTKTFLSLGTHLSFRALAIPRERLILQTFPIPRDPTYLTELHLFLGPPCPLWVHLFFRTPPVTKKYTCNYEIYLLLETTHIRQKLTNPTRP